MSRGLSEQISDEATHSCEITSSSLNILLAPLGMPKHNDLTNLLHDLQVTRNGKKNMF